jgi:hypothetical protein
MITKILRLIENLPAVTCNSTSQHSAKARSDSLALRLKNLMLKTCAIHPQNHLQPAFVKQEEFVFCERWQRHQQT